MAVNTTLLGLGLFVSGLVGLVASWIVTGTAAVAAGLATVILLAVGTVLMGVDPRSDGPVGV